MTTYDFTGIHRIWPGTDVWRYSGHNVVHPKSLTPVWEWRIELFGKGWHVRLFDRQLIEWWRQ